MKYLINILFVICVLLFIGGCSDSNSIEQKEKLEVSETSLRFGSVAMEQVVNLSASQPWKIIGIPQWLSVIPESGDAGDYEIKVSVLENAEEGERKVRLQVLSGSESWNLPVYQLEKGVLEIKDKEFLALYNHTSLQVPYRANTELDITFSEGAENWISVSDTKAVVDKTLQLSLKKNETDVLRETFIFLTNEESGLCDTLKVTQYPNPKWKLNNTKLFAKYDWTEINDAFECNIPFDVVFEDSTATWVSLNEAKIEDGKFRMSFKLTPNSGEHFNKMNIRLENKLLGLSFPMSLSQMYRTYDGHTVIWKKPTYVDPMGDLGAYLGKITFNFILVGDGFTKEEIESGIYDRYCQEAMDGILSIEPFKTYSDRFGFILLHAESKQSGCTDYNTTLGGPVMVDTRFKCAYDEFGTGMSCDFNGIQTFVEQSLKSEGEEFIPTKDVVIVVANGKRYGGVANLTRSGHGVAICPVSEEPFPNDFIQLVRHEGCGHAFGKLADEYSLGGPLDTGNANYLKLWQDAGMYLNVSMSPTELPTPWQELKDRGKLPNIYVGGFACSGGVWRSSENSLMKGMDEGFNMLSRYLIYIRMKNLRGVGLDMPAASVDDFLSRDKADEK